MVILKKKGVLFQWYFWSV